MYLIQVFLVSALIAVEVFLVTSVILIYKESKLEKYTSKDRSKLRFASIICSTGCVIISLFVIDFFNYIGVL